MKQTTTNHGSIPVKNISMNREYNLIFNTLRLFLKQIRLWTLATVKEQFFYNNIDLLSLYLLIKVFFLSVTVFHLLSFLQYFAVFKLNFEPK